MRLRLSFGSPICIAMKRAVIRRPPEVSVPGDCAAPTGVGPSHPFVIVRIDDNALCASEKRIVILPLF